MPVVECQKFSVSLSVAQADRNPHVYRLAWCSSSRPAVRKIRSGLMSLVCVSLGEAKDAIEVEATCASLLGSPHLCNDTHGGSTTKMDTGEEAGESYGKTSFLTVLSRMSRIIQMHGETCCRALTRKVIDKCISDLMVGSCLQCV